MSNNGAGNAGNAHMRGRGKVYEFACGCCWCIDDRSNLRTKAEIKEAIEDYATYLESNSEPDESGRQVSSDRGIHRLLNWRRW